MLTQARNEAIMQNERMKTDYSGSPSQESLYQMMVLQQQQQQQQDASFRLRLGGNLHRLPSLSGLHDFSLMNSFGYPPTTISSAIGISRQQLLQSIIAAEEQHLQQRRFAMQEQLVRQQREQLAMQHLAQRESSFHTKPQQHQLYPQEFPNQKNTPIHTDEVNERKRPYRETLRVEPPAREEHPEAKAVQKVVSLPSRKYKNVAEEQEERQVPPPTKRTKYVTTKKSKKKPKTEDESEAPEPKKDTKWLLMLEELKEYKAANGNCIVPRGFSPNPRLASWVAEQRKQYKLLKDGKPTSITKERVEKLQELDFAWNAQEAAWKRHMDDLIAYKEENGHCHVPLSHTTYPKLGLWVKEQRRHYTLMQQNKPSHMTAERAKALNQVGFCWDTHEATWLERLRQLSDYKERHGDCMVPRNWGANPKLATWVNHQRRQFKKFHEGKACHITRERIEQLEKLGFSWQGAQGDADADASTVASMSDVEGDSGGLPPRKRHRLIM